MTFLPRQWFTRGAGPVWGLALSMMFLGSCDRETPVEATRAYGAPRALLSAMTNDNFADATVVSALPFADGVDLTQATTEPGEPSPYCATMGSSTAWYAFTPSDTQWVTVGVSEYDGILALYQGAGLNSLAQMACVAWGSQLKLQVVPGTTYYFQVSGQYYWSGTLTFSLAAITPPANDDFAAAIQIADADSFWSRVDITAATTESGEPTPSCRDSLSGAMTVWYAFTPPESGLYMVRTADVWSFSPFVAAYAGTALEGLSEVGCGSYGGSVVFHADKDVQYYFQLGSQDGMGGEVTFQFLIVPPPVANFYTSPYDPSAFDLVTFYDWSWDPAGIGIASRAWVFGDGASSSDSLPTHRYTADGDYTVRLTVTTVDGRSASTSQVLQVRTHDVAITKFVAPSAASSGQTRSIVVGINSRRSTEWVQVQLFKSVPGGLMEVGTLLMLVPVRPSNRTTDFAFSYTFTGRDAQIGKVTFKAVATLTNARDALPADNEAIAPPTKVNR